MISEVSIVPLRRIAHVQNGGTPGPDASNWDGDVPWATPVDLGRIHGGYLQSTERSITATGLQSGSTLAPAGAVLISSRAPIGYTAIASMGTAFNQGCKALIPLRGVSRSRFLKYSVESQMSTLQAAGKGSTFTEVSASDVASLPIPTLSLNKQDQIADYLDRETAEIDHALVEHAHLRDLLFERRTEIITTATRSSNPELKEAPLVRLRHATSLNPSPRVNISPDSAQAFPLYNMDSISEFGPLRPPILRPYSELANGYSYLEPTDVAYAKVTPCFENGKGLVGTELDGPSFATTELTVFRPAPELDQNYLALVLQSADFRALGEASMTGAGGLKRVSETAARNYRFPLPDKKTQARIVKRVSIEVNSTDALISDSNRLSTLLMERRSALISAAVTGQINVTAQGVSGTE